MDWNFFSLVQDCGLSVVAIESAPARPGFYMLFAEEGEFIYVGKADNLRTRLSRHFGDDEENERIKGIVRYAIWRETADVAVAEEAEGDLYDTWVTETGTPPFANKIKPPASKLADSDILAAKLRKLFEKYSTLSKQLR